MHLQLSSRLTCDCFPSNICIRGRYYMSVTHNIRYLHKNKHRKLVCWNGAIGIATRYGLDGPGIKSRCGRDFPHPSKLVLVPTKPPIHCVPGLFLGSTAARAWR